MKDLKRQIWKWQELLAAPDEFKNGANSMPDLDYVL